MSGLTRGSYSRSPLQVVKYGAASVDPGLAQILDQLGTSKAFILTGSSLAKLPLMHRVEEILGDRLAGLNDGIGQHAPIAGIRAASKDLDEMGADTIVAVGGGSPIDSAKAIKHWRSKEGKSPINIIAIPTTLSVAETTMNAGYTDEKGDKRGLSSHVMCPDAIIYDADLTLDTPDWLWLSSGMRAVDHAVETLYRAETPPNVLSCALSSLPMFFRYLPLSKAHPENIQFREELQVAGWLSLYPNPRPGSIGPSHGLGHALGAKYSIPHGITSCITLPGCVARVARHADEEYVGLMSEAVRRIEAGVPGLPPPTTRFLGEVEAKGLSQERRDGIKLAGYIDSLIDRLGLRKRLSEYGVRKEDFETIISDGGVTKDKDISAQEIYDVLETEL
ncbi:Dehydroquinate synthase-like protein [Calocera viscosa TUFC12733]|uniref:Dehydroquinate synthase-like protein n=1 Tax=Calocera viscosa (strain TUFC12733) TaxID=1330018 RepID=A0A167S0L6_CALVF|nr:Dehydroquinate synthase-like protein [Calocera viscosa TUFC12733]